jgi:hypothetical protein
MSSHQPNRHGLQLLDGGLSDESAGEPEGIGLVDDYNVLVPDGEYIVGYSYYETAENYFGKPRVLLHFGIIKPEDYAGVPLTRFYCVKKVEHPGRKFGNFTPAARGDLVREFRRVVGDVGRLDRISFARFKGVKIRAQVKTVHKGSDGRLLEPDDQYSKISRLLGVVPDGDDLF